MLKLIRNVFVILLLGMAVSALAEPAHSSEIAHFRAQIEAASKTVGHWEVMAELQIAFVIAVICFGALITIFQGVNKGWSKPATLVLGAATTILTAVNAKVFSADYRVLQKASVDGGEMVDQMNSIVDRFDDASNNPSELRGQWLGLRTQFAGLEKDVVEGKSSTPASSSPNSTSGLLIPYKVFAQSQQSAPAWYTNPPSDQFNLYFKGSAEGTSLKSVGQQSFDDAVANGARSLTRNDSANLEMRKVVSSAASIEKSYFQFDKSRGMYKFYTLLRISNDITSLQIQESPPENSKTVIVSGTAQWTASGISINKGDTIHIVAAGRIQWNYGNLVTPEGSEWKQKANILRSKYPVADMGAGGLIGRIEVNGIPFRVGKTATIIAPNSGMLFLGINDNNYKDNAGEFSASISVTPQRD